MASLVSAICMSALTTAIANGTPSGAMLRGSASNGTASSVGKLEYKRRHACAYHSDDKTSVYTCTGDYSGLGNRIWKEGPDGGCSEHSFDNDKAGCLTYFCKNYEKNNDDSIPMSCGCLECPKCYYEPTDHKICTCDVQGWGKCGATKKNWVW
eukprot:CAMPEP_0179074810 /NCGR_PEP_ID=MMETSP0796-20121207/33275_1 /TAXON_ID=73915 /ORGANISM="Pyrodinium bahamense, Strain pbaha01" /LENGTH=152 /DNA_ID=CAMNT_0020772039 /DNA_START=49 /DNA_END=504 /DNA_ORIENTATION=+